MTGEAHHGDRLHEAERRLLGELRQRRRSVREGRAAAPRRSTGQRFADAVTGVVGSWRFILVQSAVLAAWIALNVVAWARHWDPYPFILLNLMLSFQAAYTAPFILMSQNRQQEVDRLAAQEDYRINVKAELEIELLHQKIDALREQEVLVLTRAVQELTEVLRTEQRAAHVGKLYGAPPG
jgi:uncharacterized membrane protein